MNAQNAMNAEFSANAIAIIPPATPAPGPLKVYLVLSLGDLRELTRAAERSMRVSEARLGHKLKNRKNHCVVARTEVVQRVEKSADGARQLSSTQFRDSILLHPDSQMNHKDLAMARVPADN